MGSMKGCDALETAMNVTGMQERIWKPHRMGGYLLVFLQHRIYLLFQIADPEPLRFCHHPSGRSQM